MHLVLLLIFGIIIPLPKGLSPTLPDGADPVIPNGVGQSTPTLQEASIRWGWDAHKMVCTIAWWEMEKETQDAISSILESDSYYEQFWESCLWADYVRGKEAQYDRWTTAHYVNLPRGADAFSLERDCGQTFCVVEGILESRSTLFSVQSGSSEQLDAMKFLSHFVGDIHQPMHAGYGDDRGGNDMKVSVFGNESNLHAAWDYGLIEHSGMGWLDYASHLYFDISEEDRERWASDDPGLWSEESFAIISKSAYEIENGQLGQAYYDKHIAIIETRIQQAGVRLADMLDSLLIKK